VDHSGPGSHKALSLYRAERVAVLQEVG